MATLTILEEALRGGEQARLLEQRCRDQLEQAQQQVDKTISATPAFLRTTREQHEGHLSDTRAIETQLDTLGDSLDDLMSNSRAMIEETQRQNEKNKALKSLSVLLKPYAQVAEALNASDNLTNLAFDELENCYALLQGAVKVVKSHTHIHGIKHVFSELEERLDQIKITMKSLFLNMYEIKSDCIIVKQSDTQQIASVSKSLANIDLLKDIIDDLVKQLISHNVAVSISCATTCVEQQVGEQYVINWSASADNVADSELLEFDLDDIDTATDNEIDAMTDNLDIGNAAARALRIYDVLRLKLVGESYSRELAFALQSWFCNHVLPSTVVLSSRRDAQVPENSVSNSTNNKLHSRVAAVSAAARAIQSAIRVRGVPSFVLIVEMDALEAKVGSECRAQVILKTRTAIASFSLAAHDNNEVLSCPLSSTKYVPPEQRDKTYFSPCLVTRTGLQIYEIFRATRADALQAVRGGSQGIANVMNLAAVECLRKYREDIPVQFMDELRSSLRLKALYYTDCTLFLHILHLDVGDGSPDSKAFEEELQEISNAANRAMGSIRRTAERRLDENLNTACKNGSLGTYGTLTRIQRNSSLSAAFHSMKEVISVFAQFVPTELAEVAAGRLLDRYLSKLCDEIVKLPDISAEACEQIDAILRDANANVGALMDLVSSMEKVRAESGGYPPQSVLRMRQSLKRADTIRAILNSRMEDIATAFRLGQYEGLISRQEVEHFIVSIFEDTPLRATFIAELDVGLTTETADWSNSDW